MNEPLGDKLFNIAIIVLVVGWAFGWILLIGVTLIQKLIPSVETNAENFLQKTMRPLKYLTKYALIAAAILFLIRLLAGWLGWAPPLRSTLQ